MVNDPTPAPNDKPATENGTLNDASPGGGRGQLAKFSASLFFDNPKSPVMSYSFKSGEDTWVINVTQPGHGLHFGYVLRGSVNGQAITIGEGWAWKQLAPWLSTYVNDVWIEQNQQNIDEAQ